MLVASMLSSAIFRSCLRCTSLALGSALLGAASFAHAASSCVDTAMHAAPPARALAMAALAEREHIAFGGQTMDAEGRLVEAGDNEAEDTRRPAPWQRVL